jgi:hypothetical protein
MSKRAVPPMPDGFTDRAAWDAIHWRFSVNGSVLDTAVIGWQLENQKRVKAATEAARKQEGLDKDGWPKRWSSKTYLGDGPWGA